MPKIRLVLLYIIFLFTLCAAAGCQGTVPNNTSLALFGSLDDTNGWNLPFLLMDAEQTGLIDHSYLYIYKDNELLFCNKNSGMITTMTDYVELSRSATKLSELRLVVNEEEHWFLFYDDHAELEQIYHYRIDSTDELIFYEANDIIISCDLVSEWMEDSDLIPGEEYGVDSMIEWSDKTYLKMKKKVTIGGDFIQGTTVDVASSEELEEIISFPDSSYDSVQSYEIGNVECLFAFPDINDNSLYDLYISISDYDTRPRLPEHGAALNEFIPDYWFLLDSWEGDFNGDDTTDIIGILERKNYKYGNYPRILFCILGTDSGYELSFTNYDLIPGWHSDGMFRERYHALRITDNSFSLEVTGGSSWGWLWTEQCTFEYLDSEWYLYERTEQAYSHGSLSEYSYSNYAEHYVIQKSWDPYAESEEDREASLQILETETDAVISMELLSALDNYRIAGTGSIQIKYGVHMMKDYIIPPWSDAGSVLEWDGHKVSYIFSIDDHSYLAEYHVRDRRIEVLEEV